ncbi:MAG: MBL fold metallo-hydrolase [Siphonobacter sp.]
MSIILISLLVAALVTLGIMHLPPFGKTPSGARLQRIERASNYEKGSFKYPIETPMMSPEASWWKLLRAYFNPVPNREPSHLLPVVKTDLKHLTGNEPMMVWFGHSSYFIRINGKNLLIDPVFSERTSPFQFIGTKRYPGTEGYSIDDFPELDAVIITHDHYDHLDYDSILKLIPKTRHFHAALGVGEDLERWGVKSETITEYNWGDKGQIVPGMELIATPGRHFSGRGLIRGKTVWNSYVLRTPEHTLFLGGDSGYGPHFKEIGAQYGPFDMALLECGQYNAMWNLIHMMPEETAQAAIDLRAKTLMPVHWGKFTLALHPWNEPIQRIVKKAAELHVPLATPQIGQPIVLGQPYPTSSWWDIE